MKNESELGIKTAAIWKERYEISVKRFWKLFEIAAKQRDRITELEAAMPKGAIFSVLAPSIPVPDNRTPGIPETFEGVIYKHRRYNGEGVPALRTDWGNYEIHPEDYDWAKQHYDEKVKAREMHDCYKTVRLIIH